MKKLVIALVVLVAICLIAPFGIGRLAEKRVNAQLDKLIEQAPYLRSRSASGHRAGSSPSRWSRSASPSRGPN